jgi:hypothetical protein
VSPCYCCGTKAFGGQALPVLRYKQSTAGAGFCGLFAASEAAMAIAPGAGCVCISESPEQPVFLDLEENFRVPGWSIYSLLMNVSDYGDVRYE